MVPGVRMVNTTLLLPELRTSPPFLSATPGVSRIPCTALEIYGATIDDRRQPNGIVTAKLAKRRDVNRCYREKE